MNWGKGIALALSGFIIFIVVLVVILVRQNVDLVSEDYYQEDQTYQDEIDAMQLGNQIDTLTLSQKEDQLIVQFAKNIKPDSVILNFWRPNNKQLDLKYTITGTEIFIIPKKDFETGNYEIKCTYWIQGMNFVQKNKVVIEK